MIRNFKFTVKNQSLPKCRIVAEFFYETPIRAFFRGFQTHNCTTRLNPYPSPCTRCLRALRRTTWSNLWWPRAARALRALVLIPGARSYINMIALHLSSQITCDMKTIHLTRCLRTLRARLLRGCFAAASATLWPRAARAKGPGQGNENNTFIKI